MTDCPYCSAGARPVEVEGLRIHTFSDRWISCIRGTPEPPSLPAYIRMISWFQLAYRSNLQGSSGSPSPPESSPPAPNT